jgi:hypothetical protein
MRILKLLLYSSFLVLSSSISFGQTWDWAKTAVNGSSSDWCDPYAITTDSKGNIFEAGYEWGSVTFGTYTVSGGLFLVKYDSAGNVLWANGEGGSADAFSISTDKAGNAYVIGQFGTTLTFGSINLTNTGNSDVFYVKYDPNGNVLWAKCATVSNPGGAYTGFGIQVGASNNVYLTGEFLDSIKFDSHQLYSKYQSVYTLKLDSDGNTIWARSAIVPNKPAVNGIISSNSVTTDAHDNVYIAGTFTDTLMFGSAIIASNAYLGDVFLAKYDSGGSPVWAKCGSNAGKYGANTNMIGCYSTVADHSGNVYITGEFLDSISFGSYNLITGFGEGDFFLAKYDSSGNVLWAETESTHSVASTNGNLGYSLSVDKYNNVFACGTFWDSINLGLVRLVTTAQYPSFLVKFDSNGNCLCGTQVDNYNDDYNAVAADPLSQKVYFGGDVEGSSCSFGNIMLTGIGLEFSFLAKWEPCPSTEGIDPIKNSNASISLFPNPNTGQFTIAFVGASASGSDRHNFMPATVEIYNVLGEKVYSHYQITKSSNYQIDLSSNPSGIYLYRVIDESGTLIGEGKFVIQK